MCAYVIVEIHIFDPAGYEEYKKLASATVEKYGGKYIVRGGRTEVLEGDWNPKPRRPVAVLLLPMVSRLSAWKPRGVFQTPLVRLRRASVPSAVLPPG
jgi:uncharacterized protein (DUF1330 family)